MDPDPALDQLKVSLENYLLAAPEGFPSREAAIDWLGVADAQLQRLLQLQDQCGDGDPGTRDGFMRHEGWLEARGMASSVSRFDRSFVRSLPGISVACFLKPSGSGCTCTVSAGRANARGAGPFMCVI